MCVCVCVLCGLYIYNVCISCICTFISAFTAGNFLKITVDCTQLSDGLCVLVCDCVCGVYWLFYFCLVYLQEYNL